MKFLDGLARGWNITLFHYRNHGADYGRVLAGFSVPDRDFAKFSVALDDLGYPWQDESANPAYRIFLNGESHAHRRAQGGRSRGDARADLRSMMFKAYVFDAYGTLFDVHSAIARHADTIGPEAARLSETWRTKQIEYTWNISLMGRWHDFRDLTAAALDTAAAMHGGLPAGMRATLLAAYEELDAYPDVAPALKALAGQRGEDDDPVERLARNARQRRARGRHSRAARRGDFGRRGRGLQDEPEASTSWSSGRSASRRRTSPSSPRTAGTSPAPRPSASTSTG